LSLSYFFFLSILTVEIGVIDDDKKNNGNGIDECKPKDPTVESSPSAKVNGTPNDDGDNDDDDKTEELVAESSEAECGPSSSNGQNGTENSSGTACLILEDSEDDTDEDGEEFEGSMKLE